MKNFIINVMTFVLGAIGGMWLFELITLTTPDMRQFHEENSKYFDQT